MVKTSAADKTARKQPRRAKGAGLPAPVKTGEKQAEAWATDAMSEKQASEAEALKAAIQSRPKRPVVTLALEGEAQKPVMTLGEPGNKPDMVLNSIRLYGVSGSCSNQFAHNLLDQITRIVPRYGDEEEDANRLGAAMALVGGVAPENELEATMALQMVAANEAAQIAFKRSRSAEYLEHATAFGNLGIKAMRAFALHAETLSKLRRNGEQVVKHVHVNEGGQAVIANTVTTGGGGSD